MKNQHLPASLPDGTVLNQAALRRLESDELSLKRLLSTVGRQKWPLLITMGLISGLAYVLLQSLPDVYEAEAQLLFSEARSGIGGNQPSNNRVPVTEGYLLNQIAVLSSREQGALAMVDSGVERLQEFNQESSFLDGSLSPGETSVADYELKVNGQLLSVPALAYEYWRENLQIGVMEGSDVVSIRFQSQDPQIAASLVNKLANNYVSQRSEQKKASYDRLNEKFKGELAELKSNAEKHSRAVQEFKTQHGLDETVSMGLLHQQISQLSTEMVLVRTDRVEAEARLAKIEGLANGGGGVSGIELLNSSEIRKLRDDELQLKNKIEELALEYGPLHPVMISAQSQLRSVQASQSGEASRIIASAREEAGVLRSKERSLRQSLGQLKSQIETAESHSVELVSLEREAAASQSLLDAYLARVDVTGVSPADVLLEPTVEVLSLGYPALEAIAPKRLPLLALAFLGSGLLGLIVVFARDALKQETLVDGESEAAVPPSVPVVAAKKDTFEKTQRDSVLTEPPKVQKVAMVEQPMPSRGMVAAFVDAPEAEGLAGQNDKPKGLTNVIGDMMDVTRSLPRSRYAALIDNEDGRSPFMRDAAPLSKKFVGSDGVNSVLVTSPDRTDMKALISVACARVLTQQGQRVVVVDVDFATPSLHFTMNDSNTLGLVDYLDGKINLSATIQRRQGVDLVYAGFREQSAKDYYDHYKILSVIEFLHNEYDKVVLVGPSYLVSAEMRSLIAEVDRTVYVLPENARQNRKLLSGIVQASRLSQRDAGIVHLSD